MFLYAVTDSRQLASGLDARCRALLRLAEQWALSGVDAIQIREKDLEAGALEALTTEMLKAVKGSATRIYVNGRVDVALVTGAAVHLAGGSLSPREAKSLFVAAGMPEPQISVACHSVAEVEEAASGGASIALLAPIFGKPLTDGRGTLPGLGLDILREACRSVSGRPLPRSPLSGGPLLVLALGAVTVENARQCVAAGAAGVAGIRLFLGDDWRSLAIQTRN